MPELHILRKTHVMMFTPRHDDAYLTTFYADALHELLSSPVRFALIDDDGPFVLCGGVYRNTNVAEVWFVCNDRVTNHLMWTVRTLRDAVAIGADVMDVHRVEAITPVGNRYERFANALGFAWEGYASDYYDWGVHANRFVRFITH